MFYRYIVLSGFEANFRITNYITHITLYGLHLKLRTHICIGYLTSIKYFITLHIY